MKYNENRITEGENEVILNYLEMNEEVERIMNFFRQDGKKLIGYKEKEQVIIKPNEILYIESVDGRTFAYTGGDVYRLNNSLAQLEGILVSINFYRCSKSMIMNIDNVVSLKSLSSNRIDAAMTNGEHIMITRTYAANLRKRLKGEM